MEPNDIQTFHTVWNVLLTVGAGAVGFMIRRIVEALDLKADRRELEDLKRDIRERQAAQDERAQTRDVEHGRLMLMLEQYQRDRDGGNRRPK